MNNKISYLAIALLISGISAASARPYSSEPLEHELLLWFEEEDLYISTGSAKPLHLAPSVASVITAEEIKAMGATDIYQVLETIPGIHIYPSYATLTPSISIRGIQPGLSPHVLVLRNGIPIQAASFPSVPYSFRGTTTNIERIEIIRGPGSALHGADAFSGVINIITKDSQTIGGTNFGLRAGSFDTQEAWIQHGEHYGDLEVAFNLEYTTTDGDRDRTIERDLQGNFDALFGTSASLAPGPLETEYGYWNGSLNLKYKNWDLDLWHFRHVGAGVGPGATQALDPKGKEDYESYKVTLGYNNTDLHPSWELGARLNYNLINAQRRFMLFPPGATLLVGGDGNLFTPGGGLVTFTDGMLGNPGWEQNKYTLNLNASYTGFTDHVLKLGAGFSKKDVTTNASKNSGPGIIDGTVSPIDGTLTNQYSGDPSIWMDDQDRQRWYAFAQDEWQLARDWELTTGIRYDHYSDFGKTINPRIALVWATDYNLTTKLLYGRAFRKPGLTELYLINNPSALGDPNLDPEIIDTGELAFDYWSNSDLHTKFNLFYYDMDDSIDKRTNAVGAVVDTNTKGQRGYGFELEAEWKPSKTLTLRSNFAWQHSESKDSGHHRIDDAPGRQFHLSSHWEFLPLWSLYAQANWVGGGKRTPTDTRKDIHSYTVVDLTLRRTGIAKNWEFALITKNLLDNEYEEPSGPNTPGDYPMPGRSMFAEVRYSL